MSMASRKPLKVAIGREDCVAAIGCGSTDQKVRVLSPEAPFAGNR